MVARAGPLATICCESRQAWKGAAVATASCAGVRLVRATAILISANLQITRKSPIALIAT